MASSFGKMPTTSVRPLDLAVEPLDWIGRGQLGVSCCRFRRHRDRVFLRPEGVMQRRKFSREFKLEAVKLVRERGVSVSQAARDLDLH